MNDLPGYDAWKTHEPPEPYSDDPECICMDRPHRDCPVHGRDPDQAREESREEKGG